ncbi:hypothetical protein DMUE_5109 [Dictyocoela muelleri]|nr:hypothetical protein DMUE_5109 [Dictyocoela muelleri]
MIKFIFIGNVFLSLQCRIIKNPEKIRNEKLSDIFLRFTNPLLSSAISHENSDEPLPESIFEFNKKFYEKFDLKTENVDKNYENASLDIPLNPKYPVNYNSEPKEKDKIFTLKNLNLKYSHGILIINKKVNKTNDKNILENNKIFKFRSAENTRSLIFNSSANNTKLNTAETNKRLENSENCSEPLISGGSSTEKNNLIKDHNHSKDHNYCKDPNHYKDHYKDPNHYNNVFEFDEEKISKILLNKNLHIVKFKNRL